MAPCFVFGLYVYVNKLRGKTLFKRKDEGNKLEISEDRQKAHYNRLKAISEQHQKFIDQNVQQAAQSKLHKTGGRLSITQQKDGQGKLSISKSNNTKGRLSKKS